MNDVKNVRSDCSLLLSAHKHHQMKLKGSDFQSNVKISCRIPKQ